ncbi:MAG TPA: CehA/McbA family metallohydrolase, partial [Chloroflexota bacterium]|nr:CehA/McbA family metallohydrolase [Chloroflexota bacterium]
MPTLANPFTLPGKWLRGNLHCHTTNSDGAMPPDRLLAHYSYAGWDFLSITDHGKVTTFPEGTALPDTVYIPGTEVGTKPGSTRAGTNYHICGIGVQEAPKAPEGAGPAAAQYLVDAIREQGGLAHVAHAYWSGLRLEDLQPIRGLYAIEVYNADTEVHIGRGLSQVVWDDLLTERIPTCAVAVDDCHRPAYDSIRAWTVVRALNRTPESILQALRAGWFYCSNGPEILDVQWEPAGTRNGVPYGGEVTVHCSPARSVALVCDATKGGRVNAGPFGMQLRGRRLRTETNR